FLKKKKDTIGSGGQLTIILRADEMIHYEEIAKIMLAAGEAGIKSWWITTEIEKENNSGF
ncbi:MAG: hypothetical protein QF662_07285, partial [Phycisphaerae bacterium]|nr:hypothetical protein [Phycisphaerae bacterium]